MRGKETKDLTVGSPLRLILGFAIPMWFGYLFQQFYNMVDTIIVGQCLGVGALASVGSTGSINFMINGFCIGVSSGFVIPVAQRFGAGDYVGMLEKTADYYDDEVETATQSLLSLLEPFIMIVLAFFVVILVLAIFLPMLSMTSAYDQYL